MASLFWVVLNSTHVHRLQVIFDQFFVSGEAKLMRQCGLTVMLPHGYDGQVGEVRIPTLAFSELKR